MENKPIYWQELTWQEIEKLVKTTDVALLPIGSTEQHGPHLPTGVDGFIPADIAARTSAKSGVPILPPIWYVPCAWHQNFPGAINVSPQTVIAQIVDICDSAYKSGIQHIIGINGHTGGCDSTLLAAADQVIAKTKARFWIASVVDIAADEIISCCESNVLVHADEIETSKMMAIRPDLVHIDRVKPNNRMPKSEFLHISYRPAPAKILFRMSKDDWKRLAPEGFIGDPTVATPEKGDRMLESAAGNIVKFIDDLRDWDGSIN